MRAVQDLLFIEELSFRVPAVDAAQAKAETFSMGEAAEKLCALAGLELIDYDTIRTIPVGDMVEVQLMAKAWRERWQRSADFSRR
jgi:hypothetical protein